MSYKQEEAEVEIRHRKEHAQKVIRAILLGLIISGVLFQLAGG